MTDATGTITQAGVREGDEARSSFRLPAYLDNPTAAALLVALLTVVVYWRILGFSFVNFDDDLNIFANPHMLPVSAKGIGYLWTHGYYELYMPVTYTIWAVCSYLFPVSQPIYVPGGGNAFVNPAAFHALSLILHTANSVLAFALLYRLTQRLWPACAGALLFSLHPAQVESVAWVTGMNNLTSGFFSLLALNFYLAAAASSSVPQKAVDRRYVFATLFFILALLSKPTSVALPLVAAALDSLALRRPVAKWLPMISLWAVLAIVLVIITLQTSNTSKVYLPLWVRPFIAGDALFVYLGKLVFPLKTSLNSGRSIDVVLGNWWGYATWIVPAAVALAIWFWGKNARLLQAGAVIFVAALVPMLGLVPTYGMLTTTVCDRYLYLPLVGAGLIVALFAGSKNLWSPTIRFALYAVILILLTTKTLFQLPYWQNTFTLSRAQLVINPRDAEAQTNYAISVAEQGHLPEALEHFRIAATLKPDKSVYQYHLGTALEDSGDVSGAVAPLSEAVRLDPKFTLAQIRLGGVLLKLGQSDEAVKPLQTAAEIAPNDSSAGYLLGIALAGTKRFPEAEAQFRRVLAMPGGMQEARQALGRVLEKQGRREEAAQVYQEILKATPDDAEARQGLARTAGP